MPLADYLTAPRRTAGFRQGLGPVRTPQGELRQWAHQVVEKVRVASVGGRLRFLPWYDPYTDETPEIRATYRIMLVDDAVKSAFLMKVLSVISQGVQFQPADDDNPRDRQVAQFCGYAFSKAKGGTPGLGWSVVAHGLIDGHSVCEPVWDNYTIPYGVWRGKRIFRAVKAKDTRYLQLGVDPYRNLTAIRGGGFNAGRVWSPSDFAIFSHLPLFENPAGMSDFRAAYQPFWMKRTVWNLRALHLENYTGPFIKGEYANVEQKAALEEALAEAKSSTWLTVPHGALIECIDLSMKGTADFKDAIDDCNKAILVAIAGAHLQIMEGQVPGGRGNTKVQQGTAELAQWWLSESLATVYREQLVPALVAENFHGVDTPQVSLGAVTEEAMLEMLKVDEGFQRIGALLSKADVYKRYGRQQPVEADDILRPPGQGGGAGGAPPPLPGSGSAASLASLGPEGGDGGRERSESRPFGEHRAFCQEGPNEGKPGPCPEDGETEVKSGAAVKKALAGGAGRVSLPGGAAVHVAARPRGGHVAFLRRPDGSGTSGHPRPTRAAAVLDAQTLAVGHLKGKAPVGIDLPAAASLPPEAALRDTVSRLFPGATAAAPGEYEIDMAGGRTLSLALDPESRSVRVDFQNAPESGLGQQDVPAALRAGSLDLARKLKDVAGALAAHGTRISFGAVPRKQALYARVLSSLGFTREESRPAQDATEPGQVEEVWAPPVT